MREKWVPPELLKQILQWSGVILFILIIRYLSDWLIPFFLAFVVAYILEPIVRFFQYRLHLRFRSLSVFLTLAGIAGFFIIMWILFFPIIKKEFFHTVELMKVEIQKAHLEEILPAYFQKTAESLDVYLGETNSLEVLSSYAPKLLAPIVSSLETFGEFLLALLGVLTFFLYLIFILFYFESMSSNWKKFLPPAYRYKTVRLLTDTEREMRMYFRGQTQIVLWLMLLFSLGFYIAGVPLSLLLGLFTGFLNFVPYMQWLAIVPAAFLGYLQHLETGMAIWEVTVRILLVFGIVQGIQDLVLTPLIMKKATGLKPPIILLALSVWGGLLGITGLIIALPLTSLLIHYYQIYILKIEPERRE